MFKELGLKCEVDQEDKTNSLSPFVAFYDHLGDMATSRAYIYHSPELRAGWPPMSQTPPKVPAIHVHGATYNRPNPKLIKALIEPPPP